MVKPMIELFACKPHISDVNKSVRSSDSDKCLFAAQFLKPVR